MAGFCFGMAQEEASALLLGRGGDGFWFFFIFTLFSLTHPLQYPGCPATPTPRHGQSPNIF